MESYVIDPSFDGKVKPVLPSITRFEGHVPLLELRDPAHLDTDIVVLDARVDTLTEDVLLDRFTVALNPETSGWPA